MQTQLDIDLGALAPSPALTDAIRKKAAKLERFYDRITACRVSIEVPHRHQHQGRRYQAHIQLTVPGKVLVVSHDSEDRSHEDPYVAVRDAFDAARRQLEDYARLHRGDVKTHAPAAQSE
jgi:ribosome-associated translation inhibitor RaiA